MPTHEALARHHAELEAVNPDQTPSSAPVCFDEQRQAWAMKVEGLGYLILRAIRVQGQGVYLVASEFRECEV